MNPKLSDTYQEHYFTVGNADFTFFSEPNSIAHQQNLGTTMHAHKFYELFHVLKGNITIYTEVGNVSLREGDTAILSPNLIHTTQFGPNSLRVCMTFAIKKNKKHCSCNYYEAFHKILSNPYMHTNQISNQAFKRLAYYFRSKHQERNELLISCLHEIVVLLKMAQSSHNSTSVISTDTNSLRIYIIDDYFTNNYQNGSLVKLSELLHLSPQQTQRIVKKMYAQSFSQKMIESKMNHAKAMLLDDTLSVTQIAANCGYNSTNGFFVAFKKHYGKTPNEFRFEIKE